VLDRVRDGNAVDCDGECWMLQCIVGNRDLDIGQMVLPGGSDAC
jgi:hypothetical protein